MRLGAFLVAGLFAGGALAVVLLLHGPSASPQPHAGIADRRAASEPPLSFVENRGQTDRRASYYVQGRDASAFFTPSGLALSIAGRKKHDRRFGLALDFLGARADAHPVGEARTSAVVSYFKGARKNWKTGVPTYSKVAYRDVWPGVDLVYSGSQGRLKYSFLVKPGADPNAVRLGWRGTSGLKLTPQGTLEVSTPVRKLVDDAPTSYQVVGGRQVPVTSSYALGGKNAFGFNVGSYDRNRPLVIDPAVLVYAGYIGGSADDGANNVVADGSGSLYVSGTTSSPNFPATVGPFTSYGGGIDDAFVAKVKPDGSGLAYASYIGGSGRENGIDVALDATGAAYLSGNTGSTDFPATRGPDTSFNGPTDTTDGFLAKIKPGGVGLDYATYIGGSGDEQANNVAVDASGNAYVTGFTNSNQTTFPDGDGFGTIPSFDNTFNSPVTGAPDAFAVKVNAAGTAFAYAGYIGGGAGEAGTAIAVDGTGRAYVAGPTTSNQNPPMGPNVAGGFPDGDGGTIVGPDLTYNGMPGPPPTPGDAFVARINTAGSALEYAGYIGGSGNDKPFGIAVDASGSAYVTGETTSTEATFPNGGGFGGLPGFDKTFNGGTSPPPAGGPTFIGDAFVAKVNPTGSALTYATYIGGAADEGAIAVKVDGGGAAYVSGTTRSTEATFPVISGPDLTYNGGNSDAFVAKLDPGGTALGFAGFIGGSLADVGVGVAVDPAGNVYAGGSTESTECTGGFPVRGGPDLSFNGAFGDTDAFVAKIDPTGTAAPGAGPSCGSAPPPGPAPTPGTATPPPAVGQTPAAVTAGARSLAIRPSAFFTSGSGPSARAGSAAKRTGTSVSYTLNVSASVRFTVERASKGRRVGRHCVAERRSNRKRPRCTRYKPQRGSFTLQGKTGRNVFRFSGRLAGKRLRRRSYRLVATPSVGGRTGTAARRSFRIRG